MFFSVFGQAQKHVFLSVFGSAPPPLAPVRFSMFLGLVVKNTVFYTVFLRLCTVFAI